MLLIISFLLIMSVQAQSPPSLSLEDCYALARENHPQAKEAPLINQATALRLQNLRTQWWPKVALYGQATLQSEVTSLPIELPGIEIETLAKDQYKLYAEVNQTLYDGGANRVQRELQTLQQAVESQALEVKLFQVREGIDQAFFGILLLDEQLAQLDLLEKDLITAQEKTQAAIDNGLAFQSQKDILQAERLKLKQRRIEINAAKQAYVALLARMTGQEISPQTQFTRPSSSLEPSASLSLDRPELALFQKQSKLISAQSQMLEVRKMPKAGLFVQGGYGRPALNFLSNAFTPYAIGGVRVSWDLNSFYTQKNDLQLIDIQRQQLSVQEASFRYQIDLQAVGQTEEIRKLKALLATDQEIIDLREKIQKTSQAQLENGVLTANDYVRELNAADQARQNQIIHQTQLLLAQYQLKSLYNN
ncbi:MAG: TolC family protein [Bacteroidota bacterium]